MKIRKTLSQLLNIVLIICLGGCVGTVTEQRDAGGGYPVAAGSDVESSRPLDGITKGGISGYPWGLPTTHAWQFLDTFGAEDSGYALYTYVLTSRSSTDSDTANRYKKLVAIIQSSTTPMTSLGSEIDRSQLNIFLIPGRTSSGNNQLNQELAKTLLTAISLNSKKNFSGRGPYLFSIHQPVQQNQSGSLVDIFYVDLTNVDEKAFAELVHVYKDHLIDSKVIGVDKFHSLKINLLNTALIFEASIGFVKTAQASFHDAFGQ